MKEFKQSILDFIVETSTNLPPDVRKAIKIAQHYATCITLVGDVNHKHFGFPETMRHLSVNNFLAIATMDVHRNSLHAEIENNSTKNLLTFAQSVY